MAKALPTPYYQSERVTLYCGDCLEILPHLSGVDAVVTDPPYGIGIDGKWHANPERWSSPVVKNYGRCDWDHDPASAEHLDAILTLRVSSVIFGGNYFRLPPSPCWLVWDKCAAGNFAECELAWTNMETPVRRIRWLWNGFRKERPEERWHPTQKPCEVMAWSIEQVGPANTILDPFMGSGTTGVAAVRLGRKFIGIEIDEGYCQIAKRRIQEAEQAFALFEPTVPEVQAQMFTEEQ